MSAMSESDPRIHAAIAHHRAGRLDDAAAIYAAILASNPSSGAAMHLLGVIAHQRGDHERARQLIEAALSFYPNDPGMLSNLGLVLQALGDNDGAMRAFQASVLVRPQNSAAWFNLGNLMTAAGRLDESIEAYQQTLLVEPDHAEACNNLGVALFSKGDAAGAIAAYQRAVATKPEYVNALSNLGYALASQGRLNEAIDACRRALALDPLLASAYNNLGTALKLRGDVDDAELCFRRSLELNPRASETRNNLAVLLFGKGKFQDAIDSQQAVVREFPDYAQGWSNLCEFLRVEGRLDEALAAGRRAVALSPASAEAQLNLGVALHLTADFTTAEQCFRRSVALKPEFADAHWNLSLLLLLKGEYAEGWTNYEWRWRGNKLPDDHIKGLRWDGSSLAGKTIVLHTEQGSGDSIQFIRYADVLQRQGAHVIVEGPAGLQALLGTAPGVAAWSVRGQLLPPHDCQAPFISVAGILGTTPETIPGQTPYLRAEPARVESWRPRVEQLRRSFSNTPSAGPPPLLVGIHWQGNAKFAFDRDRSMPLACFRPLAAVPGVVLVSLQKGDGAAQVSALQAGPPESRFPVVDWSADMDQDGAAFVDTAAVMELLDLIITSDTSIAHLAGALHRPTWVPLAHVPDWRWGFRGETTPWYPSMRLFRQPLREDWTAVFTAMAEQLSRLRDGATP
jgi:tetratricopeptide (TPR) repeat protein